MPPALIVQEKNDVRLLPRPSVKRRPAAGADVRSLFGSVYLCIEYVPIGRCFLLLLKASCEQRSCLYSALLTKTQCVSP